MGGKGPRRPSEGCCGHGGDGGAAGAVADVPSANAPGRERWQALWLLAQGWTAAAVAHVLERDAHTIGQWATAFAERGPAALAFDQSGGSPPC